MSVARFYTNEISRELGYLATWLPGMPVGLGEVGIIDRATNSLLPQGNLEVFAIPYEVREDLAAGEIRYASSGGVSFAVKGVGAISEDLSHVPKTSAGLGVTFHREGAVVVHADGIRQRHVLDVASLGEGIADRMLRGTWHRDWLVVTHVVEADRATILVSQSRGGKLELELSAEAEVAGIDLLSSDFAAQLRHEHSMAIAIINAHGLTPFYRAHRVKRHFFTGEMRLEPTFKDSVEEVRHTPADSDLLDAFLEEVKIYELEEVFER